MISLIAAMARNRCIGAANKLPWSLPEDLKHFRAVTSGHPVVMGRKTFESIGRVLPNRENVIVSRRFGLAVPGATVVGSLEEALGRFGAQQEIFVIGGAEIYRQALPQAGRLYLTLIGHDVEGDAFFPEWAASDFREVFREERHEPFDFAFVTLERI